MSIPKLSDFQKKGLLYYSSYRKDVPVDSALGFLVDDAVAEHIGGHAQNDPLAGIWVCESPAEELLFRAFSRRCRWITDGRSAVIGNFPVGTFPDGVFWDIRPQWDAPPYRLDFATLMENSDKKIAIEVDGHDFHDRTKEQASRDRKRDRFLQSHGWLVFRFTGSDVYKDADKCVAEVIDEMANA